MPCTCGLDIALDSAGPRTKLPATTVIRVAVLLSSGGTTKADLSSLPEACDGGRRGQDVAPLAGRGGGRGRVGTGPRGQGGRRGDG